MNDEQLKCAAMGIITYHYLLNMEEPPDVEIGDILTIDAELDDRVLEATMKILSSISMDELELYEEEM